MEAVHHLLRRSRLRYFASSSRHALQFDDRSLRENGLAEQMLEKRDTFELNERFYASLNQYSPEELSSIAAASSAEAAAVGSAAYIQMPELMIIESR